jgi:WD40 repeat protein
MPSPSARTGLSWRRGATGEAGQPQSIYLFRRDTGALVQHLKGLPNPVLHLVFSPTGRFLAATLAGGGGLRVYDRDASWGEVARDAPYDDHSHGGAFAADGRLATTSGDTVRLYDHPFQRVARANTFLGVIAYDLAFPPARDRLAVGYADRMGVGLFDGYGLGPPLGLDTHGIDNGTLANVAWSANGATLYAGGAYQRTGTTHVVAWSAGGAGPRRELAAGTNSIMSLRPLPDGGLLVRSADPWLAVLHAAGAPRWVKPPPQADLRG